MQQTRLFFTADADQARRISDAIETCFETEGYPVSAFETDEATQTWSVSVYVPSTETESVSDQINDIIRSEGITSSLEQQVLEDKDWVSETLKDLKPVRAGRYIVHGNHTPDAAYSHEHSILIDAGQAFGTGHHGTTAGCLEMLERCLKRRSYKNALDLGTGSGVLAIALAKSAPMNILATDIDPVAIRVAKQNVRLNSVSGRVQLVTAAGFSNRVFRENGPFDLIVANILAGPLHDMATPLCQNLDRNATVILSGLLPHQRSKIIARYGAEGLRHVHIHTRDGWIVLIMERSWNPKAG